MALNEDAPPEIERLLAEGIDCMSLNKTNKLWVHVKAQKRLSKGIPGEQNAQNVIP